MRRSEKAISDRTAIDAIIRQSSVMRLAMCREDRPYMVPLSFGYDGDALYFHTASEGKKLDIMIANPSVCFEFEQDVSLNTHDTLPCKWGFSFKSVIGHGEVSEVTSAEYKKTALNHILQTYSNQEWDFQDAAVAATRVWKITIHQLTGKQS